LNQPGNILILTQWSYKDALVQTYTLPYVRIIRNIVPAERKIFLVTAEQQPIALDEKEIASVNSAWKEMNMQLVALPYKKFGWRKMINSFGQLLSLASLVKKKGIKTIHAFCTPAGSIAYLLSKLTGAVLIIDSYEPHAEAMVENGTWKKSGMAYKLLYSLEKKQTKKAYALIATTAGMKQYAMEKYGVAVKKFFTKPACVDLEKFSPTEKDAALLKELQLENKLVCVYAGKLGGIYLKEEVFDLIKSCYEYWGDRFRFLMLTNASKEEIETEKQRVQLPDQVVISRFVFHQEVPRYLSLGDFAINPVKPVPTKKYCTSIKDGEYWAMGLPVVISPDISDDSAIIEKENTGVVVDFSKKEFFPGAIKKLETIINSAETKNNIRSQAIQYRSYIIAEKIYKEIYI
jgi:glycosyltransferase involved in cell wall biosynthesis